MAFYAYRGYCLCPRGGDLPAGALAAEAPFSPLVFLVRSDGQESRGFYAISSLSELKEPEGVNLLLPPAGEGGADALIGFVTAHGAVVLNTAFSRCFDVLAAYRARRERPARLALAGLGDVGGAALTGLVLLGAGTVSEIGIYDTDEKRLERYELELNQILPLCDGAEPPRVTILPRERLFDCDALLFTASRGVPAVGAEASDVRMAQYGANRELLSAYAREARESGFAGLFFQISDPVDLLSRAVFLESSRDASGAFDGRGLLPEQVRGLGLGVMRARALYHARREGIDTTVLCAFGPHGAGLVIANAPSEGYDDALSVRLTEETERANLAVRALGYKPYIAPGLSSACVSVLRALRGEWHDAAVPIGGVWFGCRSCLGALGPEILRAPLHEALVRRVGASYARLKELGES